MLPVELDAVRPIPRNDVAEPGRGPAVGVARPEVRDPRLGIGERLRPRGVDADEIVLDQGSGHGLTV